MSGQSEQSFRKTLMQREKEIMVNTLDRSSCVTDCHTHTNLCISGSRRLERINNAMHGPEFKEATQTGFSKALLHLEFARQRETKLAHAALILVRREALRRVLEEEQRLYAQELSQKGMAIYKQRI